MDDSRVKPIQNKKGQKIWGTRKKAVFFLIKGLLFLGYPKFFFGPSYYEAALVGSKGYTWEPPNKSTIYGLDSSGKGSLILPLKQTKSPPAYFIQSYPIYFNCPQRKRICKTIKSMYQQDHPSTTLLFDYQGILSNTHIAV